MRSARQLFVRTAAVGAVLLGFALPSHSGGDAPALTSDRIIYGKGDSLWSMPSDGGLASELVTLGGSAKEVSRIKVAASGTAMLISIGGLQAWVDLSDRTAKSTLHFLPCGEGLGTSPDISADGDKVVCATQAGSRVALYQLRPKLDVDIVDRPANGPIFFAGDEHRLVGFGPGGTLVNLRDNSLLAPHRPDRSMATTANGKRAIGAFSEEDIDVVYAFRLDGKGVKRTLMQAARVVSISAGSEWASLQQEVDACGVRIAGGQYMCWRRYEAMDISSKAKSLLLSRAGEKTGHDLFLGSIRGTSARTPTPLVQSIERAAAFWPAKEDGAKEDGAKEDGAKEDGAKEDGAKEAGTVSFPGLRSRGVLL
ncbi:MAG: hypothetical protein GY811_10460 [Myxococcales bacterium]|nr:hypothetical protein [Myxococcales bacterium]